MRRPPPPLWFLLLLGVLEACAWRWLITSFDVTSGRIHDLAPPALGFWPLIGLIASWIWTGVQVAGKVTLQILAWSVKALWAFAIAVNNAAIAVGKLLALGFHKAWDFLRLTYEHVLRPAWTQFWKWIDRARSWLEHTFGPVLRFLQKIRQYVLDFYAHWVRPILDVISIARRVLTVLASFGLEWARALDRKLREIEEKIDAPFRAVIGALNELIGVVNRVITADGLFQRLALIRSVERDMRFVGRAIVNWRSMPLTPAELAAIRTALEPRSLAVVEREAIAHIEGTGGPRAGLINEMVLHWTREIERQ